MHTRRMGAILLIDLQVNVLSCFLNQSGKIQSKIKLTNVKFTIAIYVILIWLQTFLIWLHITYIWVSKESLKIVNLTVNLEQKIKFDNT